MVEVIAMNGVSINNCSCINTRQQVVQTISHTAEQRQFKASAVSLFLSSIELPENKQLEEAPLMMRL